MSKIIEVPPRTGGISVSDAAWFDPGKPLPDDKFSSEPGLDVVALKLRVDELEDYVVRLRKLVELALKRTGLQVLDEDPVAGDVWRHKGYPAPSKDAAEALPGPDWHNPDCLTPEEIGAAEGWRLCVKGERRDPATQECWDTGVVTGSRRWMELQPRISPELLEDTTYRTKAPLPGAPPEPDWHNPDGLTPEQVGVAEGWRLCVKGEARKVGVQEFWHKYMCRAKWTGICGLGLDMDLRTTYRTKEPLPAPPTPAPVTPHAAADAPANHSSDGGVDLHATTP